jgi:hypothetical protein
MGKEAGKTGVFHGVRIIRQAFLARSSPVSPVSALP